MIQEPLLTAELAPICQHVIIISVSNNHNYKTATQQDTRMSCLHFTEVTWIN